MSGPDPKPPKRRKVWAHGTLYGYVIKKCRCEPCRQANRDYKGVKSREEYLAERRNVDTCKRGHSLDDAYRFKDGRRDCRECRRERNRAYKKRHPEQVAKWRRRPGPRELECPQCHEKRVVFSPLTTKLCARCYHAVQRERASKPCAHCGQKFTPSPRTLKHCSLECRIAGGGYVELGKKLSRDRGGDGNLNVDSTAMLVARVPGWRLDRKGETNCRNCGSRERVQLHHAIPRSRCRSIRADLRNGVPLCWVCHTGWHSKTVVIPRSIFKPEEWQFISHVDLGDREIGPWLDKHYPETVAA